MSNCENPHVVADLPRGRLVLGEFGRPVEVEQHLENGMSLSREYCFRDL